MGDEVRKRIVGPERAAARAMVCKMYIGERLPLLEIAERTGFSYGLVRKLMDEAGVSRRQRNGPHRRR